MIRSHSCRGTGLPAPALDQWLSALKVAGYEAIDLPVRDIFEQGLSADRVKEMLAECQIQCGASPFPYDWRGSDLAFQEMLAKLPGLLDYAKSIGVTRFYTRVSESLAEGESYSQSVAWHNDRLALLADLFAKYGMRLGLESIGVESFRQGREPFLTTLRAIRHELHGLFTAHANLGLLVDALHLHAASETLEEAIGPYRDRIVGVHVADLPEVCTRAEIIDHVRALPGTSNTVPVSQTLRALAAIGCDAPVMVETVKHPPCFEGLSFAEKVACTHQALVAQWPG